MAFCRKCGKEIDDEAVVCIHCGCATDKATPPAKQHGPDYDPDSKADFVEILLSVLIPIAGIIMYFVKKDTRPKAAKTCLLVGIITWALGAIAMALI